MFLGEPSHWIVLHFDLTLHDPFFVGLRVIFI